MSARQESGRDKQTSDRCCERAFGSGQDSRWLHIRHAMFMGLPSATMRSEACQSLTFVVEPRTKLQIGLATIQAFLSLTKMAKNLGLHSKLHPKPQSLNTSNESPAKSQHKNIPCGPTSSNRIVESSWFQVTTYTWAYNSVSYICPDMAIWRL